MDSGITVNSGYSDSGYLDSGSLQNSIVKSPGQRSTFSISLEEGKIYYSATQDGKTIIEKSPIGMVTTLGDFSEGLTYKSTSEVKEINETYKMYSGKKAEYQDHANEVTYTFTKGNMEFDVIVRAYDDGIAYRCGICKADGTPAAIEISDETTSFIIPANSDITTQAHTPDSQDRFSHEGPFEQKKIENLNNSLQTLPFLYKTPDDAWTLLTEADLDGSYTGSAVKRKGSTTELNLDFVSQQKTNVKTKVPFKSPWRLAISGNLGDIVESTMVQNVSPANKIDDADEWIKPGVTGWGWLSPEGSKSEAQYDEHFVRSNIDFASKMGWSYYIMDEGWQPQAKDKSSGRIYEGYFPFFYDPANPDDPNSILNYAKAKNVGLIAWTNCRDLDSPEERQILKEWSDLGIKGIKVDFFDRESQDRIQLMNDLYKECAKQHMLMNLHGCNKPTGEVRTWPNAINREAIRGEEGSTNASQFTMQAFTRGVVGPTDITPFIYPKTNTNITTAQQLAINFVFESGLPCMASPIKDYERSPGLPLLQNLPAAWDETKYIDGLPGQFVTVARRSQDIWYTASINTYNNGSDSEKRDAVIPLVFLKPGESYHATIYKDGATKNDLLVEQKEVTSETTLTIPMSPGGGCIVKITQGEAQTIGTIQLDKTNETLSINQSLSLFVTTDINCYDYDQVVWSTSNPDAAIVSNSGVVSTLKPGKTTITASSSKNPAIKAECKVTVLDDPYKLADGWSFVKEIPIYRKLLAENQLELTILPGEIGSALTFKNFLYRDAPEGDFTMTVKIKSSQLDQQNQAIGLSVFQDDKVNLSLRRRFTGRNCFETYTLNESGWRPDNRTWTTDQAADTMPSQEAVWLKIEKIGDTIKSSFSYNNTDWTTIKNSHEPQQVSKEGKNLKIGVHAVCGNNKYGPIPVVFEDFTVNGKVINFATPTNVSVMSVSKPSTITVKQGTAFEQLTLPATVNTTLSTGVKKDIAVVWSKDGYNPNAAGTYELTGTLTMADGITNPSDLKASISVVVQQNTSSTTITEVSKPSSITVKQGTAFEQLALPATVNATLSTGAKKDFAVVWSKDGYNPNAAGTYELTGTLTMADGITNPSNLKVSISIVMQQNTPSTTIADISKPSSITVKQGTAFEQLALPATVNTTLLTGAKKDFAVMWSKDGYNPNVAGTYEFTGTLTMADGITNPLNLKANISVVVQGISEPKHSAKSSSNNFVPNMASVSDIRQKLQSAPDNANVLVDVSSNYNFSTSIFDELQRNKNKSITLNGEWYKWIFEGKDIINSMPGVVYFDTRISVDSPNETAISKLVGNADITNLYFNYEGKLPGKTTICVQSEQYKGKTIYIYYYNPVKNQLELVKSNVIVDANGWFEFSVTHCSDYVISTTPITKAIKGTTVQNNNPETGGISVEAPLSNTAVLNTIPEETVPAIPDEQIVSKPIETTHKIPWVVMIVAGLAIPSIAASIIYKRHKNGLDK